MGIESDLASIKIHLADTAKSTTRIANALEALLSERGYVPPPPDDQQQQLDLEPEPTKKKASKKKKKTTKKTVGKKKDKEPSEFSLKDIRALLHKLQSQENQATVKSTLKKFNASTLGQVDESKYDQLAADIESQLDE